MKFRNIFQQLLFVAVLFVGFAFIGTGQVFAQSDSVAGEWDAMFSTPGGTSNFKIVFEVDGEKLTGTVKRSSGDRPLEGTIKGNDLKFSYSIFYNGNALTLSYTGKRDGDKITGVVYFGESGQSSDWSATRAAKE